LTSPLYQLDVISIYISLLASGIHIQTSIITTQDTKHIRMMLLLLPLLTPVKRGSAPHPSFTCTTTTDQELKLATKPVTLFTNEIGSVFLYRNRGK
jgi:hypothetical protein